MTVSAENMELSRLYRLTRDPWPGTYYMRCPDQTRRQLEKRLSSKNPRTMTPDDFRAWKALLACREGQVLGIRFLRFRDEEGAKHESREYVAFPADYPLREVARPPGYVSRQQAGRTKEENDAQEAEEDDRAEAS